VFIRRIYLDVIGTLPTAQDVRDFLADADSAKRAKLIDRVLQRDEFADYWALKWSDLLRVKSEFPINLWPNAVQAYHRWIHTSIFDNVPYDRFVQEMLKSSGSNFRVGQVNFYRAMQGNDPTTIAKTVALTFMGTGLKPGPRSGWRAWRFSFPSSASNPPENGRSRSFSSIRRKARHPRKTRRLPRSGQARSRSQTRAQRCRSSRRLSGQDRSRPGSAGGFCRLADDAAESLVCACHREPHLVLAAGRGIVQEPDDIRPDNPPVNPELLRGWSMNLSTPTST